MWVTGGCRMRQQLWRQWKRGGRVMNRDDGVPTRGWRRVFFHMRDTSDDSLATQAFKVLSETVMEPSARPHSFFFLYSCLSFCVYVRRCHPRLRSAQFMWNYTRQRTSKQAWRQKQKKSQDNTQRSVRRKTAARPRTCVNSNSNTNYWPALNASLISIFVHCVY